MDGCQCGYAIKVKKPYLLHQIVKCLFSFSIFTHYLVHFDFEFEHFVIENVRKIYLKCNVETQLQLFFFSLKILAFLLLWSLQGDIVLRYFKPLIFWNIVDYNIEPMKSKCPPLCSWYSWKAFQWCDLGMFRSMVQKLLNIEYLVSMK